MIHKRVKNHILLFLLLPMCCFGMDRISALSMIETGNDDYAVGSAGEISRFQVRKSEWRSVTDSANYANPETAAAVVRRLMEKRVAEFEAVFKHSPSDFEFYALWNAPSQMLQGHISHRVAERCRRFANLCARDRRFAQASGNGPLF